MILIKDLGMVKRSEKRSYRKGVYKCPRCEKTAVRYTHNVKKAEQLALEGGREPVCQNCMLKERNSVGVGSAFKFTSESSKAVQKVYKDKVRKSKTTVVSKARNKYRHMTFDVNTLMWNVEVPIPGEKGKKKSLGEFKDEELAQNAILEFLSHYQDNF